VALTDAKHNTKAVIRFPQRIEDINDLSFFYSESTERCAMILPKELRQLELADIGMSVVLRQFNTSGAQIQTVTARI
jgi:hypothetical protein